MLKKKLDKMCFDSKINGCNRSIPHLPEKSHFYSPSCIRDLGLNVNELENQWEDDPSQYWDTLARPKAAKIEELF
ncbi:hypothetical protein TNCV_3663111 [Trichonephila clavipes]|nr:hypothetical protein TNCV_3663111 [Trichonephila clavipes]